MGDIVLTDAFKKGSMTFNRANLSLFYTLPLEPVDFANLALSHVKRVQLVAALTTDAEFKHLEQLGVTHTTLRLNNAELATDASRRTWADRLRFLKGYGVDVVLLGNEPDAPFDLRYGSKDWGQGAAFTHAQNTEQMRQALVGTGLRVVSAAFTYRSIEEDATPQPGIEAWAEETRWAYDACDLNGYHIYLDAWDGNPINVDRLKWGLRMGWERHHKPLYCDEIGMTWGTDVQKAQAWVDIARLLEKHPLGKRVEALTVFAANGDHLTWDSRFLMRDPAAYSLIGEFMAGG